MRNLTSFDMIMGIEDESRMGGFRFSKSPDGQFINMADRLSVPPIISLRELIAASHAIEDAEEKGILADQKWIYQLQKPGTSLGGARPKANVIDEDGFMKMAKFPSRNDSYDLNPTTGRYQGIMISRDTNESDLDALLKAAEDYFIPKSEAEGIIKSVKEALKDWQKVAKRLGASERDISLFSRRVITE